MKLVFLGTRERPKMNNPSWLVQICEMADNDSRRWVGGLLKRVHGLIVEVAPSGSDRFLMIGCSSKAQALAVQRFVATVDPTAVVMTSRAPVERARNLPDS